MKRKIFNGCKKKEIIKEDPRYSLLKPFKNGHIYTNNKRINSLNDEIRELKSKLKVIHEKDEIVVNDQSIYF